MSGWTIARGDWPHFDIEPARDEVHPSYSNEALNGVYPTRLEAIEQMVSDLEMCRHLLAEQIARAKRMRRRELTSPRPDEREIAP